MVREGIFQGRFAPGAALRELTLARELNVSQATIRDALQRLEHAGLVTRKPNIGTTVTRLSPKDIRERVALRAMLETTAAEAAAGRMTDADFVELERRLAVLGATIAADNYYEAAQSDLEFHRYIWQCSGNETLCRLLELVAVPLFAFISILRSQGLQRLTDVVDEHSPLVEALRSRDRARIHAAFEKGATTSYEPFLGEATGERNVAQVFGFLGPAEESQPAS
jgi:DNA-binding GntR family transcriptional regulator